MNSAAFSLRVVLRTHKQTEGSKCEGVFEKGALYLALWWALAVRYFWGLRLVLFGYCYKQTNPSVARVLAHLYMYLTKYRLFQHLARAA